MELKDLILETLNELSQPNTESTDNQTYTNLSLHQVQNNQVNIPTHKTKKSNDALREEYEFLEMLQERLLVLFAGLKAPQNNDIQSRLNITINFLEYQLSVIQERLDDIKK